MEFRRFHCSELHLCARASTTSQEATSLVGKTTGYDNWWLHGVHLHLATMTNVLQSRDLRYKNVNSTNGQDFLGQPGRPKRSRAWSLSADDWTMPNSSCNDLGSFRPQAATLACQRIAGCVSLPSGQALNHPVVWESKRFQVSTSKLGQHDRMKASQLGAKTGHLLKAKKAKHGVFQAWEWNNTRLESVGCNCPIHTMQPWIHWIQWRWNKGTPDETWLAWWYTPKGNWEQ